MEIFCLLSKICGRAFRLELKSVTGNSGGGPKTERFIPETSRGNNCITVSVRYRASLSPRSFAPSNPSPPFQPVPTCRPLFGRGVRSYGHLRRTSRARSPPAVRPPTSSLLANRTRRIAARRFGNSGWSGALGSAWIGSEGSDRSPDAAEES